MGPVSSVWVLICGHSDTNTPPVLLTCKGPRQGQSGGGERNYKNWTRGARMRPRYLLSCVDRLPTISEIQELDLDEADLDSPGFGMDEYKDSIRELSQPPQPYYPLHGPLRSHHHWVTRAVPPRLFYCPRTSAVSTPIEVSDVSLTVTGRASRYFNKNVMDSLVAQSVFAGL